MLRAWRNRKRTVRTKALIYQACVLSTLLYGSETWTTYAKQERHLDAFHQRCLRKIMGISWQDKVTNEEVLKRTGLQSIPTILGVRRLRWLGHIDRMENSRIPKQVLYGELKTGERSQGGPALRFKDLCRKTLSAFGINAQEWRNTAADRSKWRSEVKRGARKAESDRAKSKQNKKLAALSQPKIEWPCKYCNKICRSQIGRFNHEKRCCSTTSS